MGVSEQTLLEGSWHALAQAGHLLRSAVLLSDSGEASSALALAMFGREELGRSRMLRDCAGDVKAGKAYTPSEITSKCDAHVAKQEASAFSIALRPSKDGQLSKALLAIAQYPPSSPQFREADQIIEMASEAKRKRQAHDRHEARCNGIYVDLDEARGTWRRPVDLSVEEARQHILEAANDYSMEVDRLSQKGLFDVLRPHIRAKEMHAARQQMPPFDLPAACWPK